MESSGGDYGTVPINNHNAVSPNQLRLSLPARDGDQNKRNPFASSTSGFRSVEGRKKSDYQSIYTVKDPHMEFYKQVRSRDKSKELHGPMRLKIVNSFDRIKSELEIRKALPGNVPHENWDVVPIVR